MAITGSIGGQDWWLRDLDECCGRLSQDPGDSELGATGGAVTDCFWGMDHINVEIENGCREVP